MLSLRNRIFISMLLLIATLAYGQDVRIQGTVRDESSRPLAGVLISDVASQEVVGTTDEDGKYQIYAPRNGKLLFESLGCKSQELQVKGRQLINVTLEVEAVMIEEVQVTAQLVNKIIPEPTDIEVRGNYLVVRTRFRVPKQLFKSNTRLLVQPSIVNVSKQQTNLLSSVVLDGEQYRITQQRMYGFDYSKDPLSPYSTLCDRSALEEAIPYVDSLYVDNPNHDVRFDFLLSLENYNNVLYTDSFVLAKGTVNPLRFFEYDVMPLSVTDERHIPKPELQLCNDRGEVRLTFNPGVAKIDMNAGDNSSEVDRLRRRLQEIEMNPDMSLQTFNISGLASPEGAYERNVKLAKDRMKSASETILSTLTAETKRAIKIKTEERVAGWDEVAELMESDNMDAEAASIRDILKKWPKNRDDQFYGVRRLKFYRPTIVDSYLPKLRKVEYQFEYSLFRVWTDDEIKRNYQLDPSQLSRYEFYRLMLGAKDTAEVRDICSKAIEMYPKFMLAANEIAILNLKNGNPDINLLIPFINRESPSEVVANQALTCLKSGFYSKADSLLRAFPNIDGIDEIYSVTKLLNGDYSHVQSIIEKGGLNEVLVLLAQKNNEEAYEKSKNLEPYVAKHEYIMAVAANRLDKVMEALMHIENAFDLDPSLRETAALDGDVLDLLE